MDRIDAVALAPLCMREHGSGDKNVALLFGIVFCSARRRVLFEKIGKEEPLFAICQRHRGEETTPPGTLTFNKVLAK